MKTYFFYFCTFAMLLFWVSCSESKRGLSNTNPSQDIAQEAPTSVMYEKSAQPSMSRESEEISFDDNHNGKSKLKTDEYDKITENIFHTPSSQPLSTFSIDVDNASYTNARSYLMGGTLPHADMVRTEEFINYFDYDYDNPSGDEPFAINTEVCNAPWNPENKLVRVALQGKKLDFDKLVPANLVFLIDASGSMEDENKLPLLIKSLKILLNNLSSKDKISIVAYAGAAGVVLPPTSASEKEKILKALENVKAGGSTAGGEGLLLAYKMAKEGFIENGNNRVILATDGDFNVGVSSTAELVRLLEEKKKDKIYLTICGFGMGNYKDSRMKKMASTADGNYYFIDNITEATRIFGKEIRATLFTIAKDVKIQIEFNPKIVQAYRLIGYESRLLKNEDFNDDTKDAGELGAGHRVTAIYEIIPVGVKSNFVKSVDDLKYASKTPNNGNANELMTVKLRYKKPNADTSLLITKEVKDADVSIEKASENMRFATSVAAFAAILRRSEFKQNTNYEQVLQLANGAKGKDEEGYRAEFVKLVKIAQELDKK